MENLFHIRNSCFFYFLLFFVFHRLKICTVIWWLPFRYVNEPLINKIKKDLEKKETKMILNRILISKGEVQKSLWINFNVLVWFALVPEYLMMEIILKVAQAWLNFLCLGVPQHKVGEGLLNWPSVVSSCVFSVHWPKQVRKYLKSFITQKKCYFSHEIIVCFSRTSAKNSGYVGINHKEIKYKFRFFLLANCFPWLCQL